MRVLTFAAACLVVLTGAGTADAQTWTGLYVGGSIGGGFKMGGSSETISFDTNLDGAFADTVRTAAGVNAFSPGFCGGLAMAPTPTSGCTQDDERSVDFGGRVGYDWQFGRFVVGGLVDISKSSLTDSVSAFSTTPAFYALTRETNFVTGFRGRAGIGTGRLLVYGTAGGAWASIDQTFTTSNVVNTFVPLGASAGDLTQTENVFGYQAGGGIEFRLGGRWTLTSEYVLTMLDNRDKSVVRSQGPAPATNAFILVNSAGTDFRRTEKSEFQAARVAIGYRF